MRRKSYIIVLIVLVGFLSNVSSLNELSKDEVSTIRSVSLLSLFVMQQESPFIQIIPYPLSSHSFSSQHWNKSNNSWIMEKTLNSRRIKETHPNTNTWRTNITTWRQRSVKRIKYEKYNLTKIMDMDTRIITKVTMDPMILNLYMDILDILILLLLIK